MTSYRSFNKDSRSPTFIAEWMVALVTLGVLDWQLESQGGALQCAQREGALGLGWSLERALSLPLPSQALHH